MRYLNRRMKKVAPLAVLGLLLLDHSPVNPSAKALVGGPFDDNSYPGSNADGTYSGTLTGRNLIGIITFGVASTAEGLGRFSVFHEGFVSYGAASGMADLASRRVAGALLGVAGIPGETTPGSGTDTNATGQLTVRSSAEGAFIAKMKGYPQQITFEGEGELSTSANTAVVTQPSGATGPSFTVFVDAPGASGSDTAAQGAVGTAAVDATVQSSVLRTSTPFKIRGSRTSRTGFLPSNSYTGVEPFDLDPVVPVAATPAPAP